MIPPKPKSRPDKVSLWRYLRLFRRDILSAQPERLYRAWMAEFKTPFFQSFLLNQPDLVAEVLKHRPQDFPKSDRVTEGLRPLLGGSVFVTNGAEWERQRRIIDPAFEGGRLKQVFPSMLAAADAAVARLQAADGPIDVEEAMSHVAADVIFRTMFSIPIEHRLASEVYDAFRTYQRSQPIVNLGAFLPLPRWMPRFVSRKALKAAKIVRANMAELTDARLAEIKAGTAPPDLATKIMTTVDPVSGNTFDTEEMVDQLAIFFLAGHETSASAMAWCLYLLACAPEWQEKIASEVKDVVEWNVSAVARLHVTRDVFKEALRLYPPVPMMVRTATKSERFRDRIVPKGAQLVISPWHLHRHIRLWEAPDEFAPNRWQTESGRHCAQQAYVPFSAGARVCPGAGFAMIEGPLILAWIIRQFDVRPNHDAPPVPVAHLTVRSENGIRLIFVNRLPQSKTI